MTEIVISLIAVLKIALLLSAWLAKRYIKHLTKNQTKEMTEFIDERINGKLDNIIKHQKRCETNQSKIITLWKDLLSRQTKQK